MLVTLTEILTKAKQENYAVPACNIDNEHNLRAAIEAAEEMNSSIILNTTPVANPDLVSFGHLATDLARRSCVKVALNLDHGKSFEDCLLGIRAGYTSIMIDRSLLPFEENVREVKEMVRICHALGISVEAELGHVGNETIYEEALANYKYTDPNQAAEFVERTNCDSLAVAIGNQHGVYTSEPKLNFEVVEKVRDAVSVPLVLHGASGIGDEDIRTAISLGITKINIHTELCQAAMDAIREHTDVSFLELERFVRAAVKQRASEKIVLFGADGKAN